MKRQIGKLAKTLAELKSENNTLERLNEKKEKSVTAKVTLHADENLYLEMKEVTEKLNPLLRKKKMEGKNPVQFVLSALLLKFFIPQITEDTVYQSIRLPTNNTIDRTAINSEDCLFNRETGDTTTKILMFKFPSMKPAAARTLLVSRINSLKKQVKKGGTSNYTIMLENSLEGYLD